VLETIAQPDAHGLKLLRDASETMRLSARGYHRVLRVARPVAHSGRFRRHKSAKETVKTIARGMPGDPGVTMVTNACAFYTLHTRLRVQRAPGFPCAL
jgi:hypothetical protein